MIREHYAAVAELIPSKYRVHVGEVGQSPTYPYVLVWGDPGQHGSETLDDVPREFEARIRVTVAAESWDACAGLLDATRAALNRKVPVVADRVCGRLRQESRLPIQPDNDVTLPNTASHPVFATDEYTLWSDRTT